MTNRRTRAVTENITKPIAMGVTAIVRLPDDVFRLIDISVRETSARSRSGFDNCRYGMVLLAQLYA